MKNQRHVAVGLLGCLIAATAFGGPPAGFVEQEIPRPDGAAQWNGIVGIQFLDSGRGFAWEREGRVWIVDPANPSTQPFVDISDEVGGWRDHGLLGFALDPNFIGNGYVYLLYVVDQHHLTHCDSSQQSEGPAVCDAGYSTATNQYFKATIGRLARYRAIKPSGDADYRRASTVDYSSRLVLVGNTPKVGKTTSTSNDPAYPYPPLPASQSFRLGCTILYESHSVGSLVFGEDGTLLAACGDGASYNVVDAGSVSHTYYQEAIALGLTRQKDNVGAFRAQLVDNLGGKIWRIDPGTGAGVPSNPFYDATATFAARSRVWALGLRNPYRMTLRPDSGSHLASDGRPGVLYIGDVGWGAWEELDVNHSGGQNFGWPLGEGMNILKGPGGYDIATANLDAPNPLFGTGNCPNYVSFNSLLSQDILGTPSFPNPCNPAVQLPATLNLFVHSRPVIDWAHGSTPNARWAAFNGSSPESPQIGQYNTEGTYRVIGVPFLGNASTGGVWYRGDQFPAQYKNTYFHADYGAQWIQNFTFNSVDFPVEVRPFGTNEGGVVGLAENPVDGTLYYISWATYLRKVRYVGTGNLPPTAVLSATPTYGPSPLLVQFNGGGSSDPEGSALTYEWNFGDGTPMASGVIVSHQYVAPSSSPVGYTATLTVRDSQGASGTGSITITPNDTPPTAVILNPIDGSTYAMTGNTIVNLVAQIDDAESGPGSLTCEWLNVLHHNDHTHQDALIQSCSATTTISPLGCGVETYYFSLHLKVTDPQGQTVERTSSIYPRCDGNLPPLAADDSAEVAVGGGVSIPVLANDTDTDGLDPSTVTVIAAPRYGTVTVDAVSGLIQYTHDGGSLPDRFYYVVKDSLGSVSNTAFVDIAQASGPPDITAPTIPQGLSALGTSSTRIDLNWLASTDAGTGVAGYRVYRDGLLIGSTAQTTYGDTGRQPSTSYTYRVTAYDAASPTNESDFSAPAMATTFAPPADVTPPTVPTGLSATAVGQTQVNLSWSASTDSGTGVAGYRVFRDGTAVGTSTSTSYSDTGLLANTLYTYTVSAYDAATPANESVPSAPSTATTLSASAFQSQDIGAPALVGSFTENGGVYTMRASGADIWGDTDAFRYGWQALSGDGQITVRVASLSNTHSWAKAGLMLRETLTATSRHASMFLTVGAGAVFQYRTATGGASGPSGGGDLSNQAPYWLRLVRQGNVITGYSSPNGVTWTQRGTVTLANLPANVYVGLAYTSHNDAVLGTAQFDNLALSGSIPVNQPPMAAFTVDTTSGVYPLVVNFDGRSSSDPDGSIASYAWDFGDRTPLGSGSQSSHVYAAAGTYIATLTVTDNNGATALANPVTITVLAAPPVNQAPVVNAGADTSGYTGQTVHLEGTATDDGLPNPPGALTVGWTLISGPASPTWPLNDQGSAHAHAVFSAPGNYVLRLTASDGVLSGSDDINITVTTPPADVTPPTVPTGLSATAVGQTQVNLSWSASTDSGTGVAGYRVFRDGTAVGTSTSTSYSDTGLLANTLYTYTVSAYDAATPANESVPSAPSTATTLSASAFQSQDIGAPALVGSFTENGGVYTMRASGADIWGDTDAFRYGWQALSGDGQITVRVASLSNTHSWAKAGLMLRETLTATSRHASMFLTVGAGAVFQYRTATGGASGPSGGGDLSNQAPYWLRLVRQGNVITGYSSPNGVTWTQRGTVTLANLPANVYVGLAYTSHNDAVLGTAQFDNLALSGSMPVNQAPVVNAGADTSGYTGQTVHLEGTATDDGLPNPPAALTVGWVLVSGPAAPTWPLNDQGSAHAHAVFSTPGNYVLRLTASDGVLSGSDDINITVTTPPADVTPPTVPTGLSATAVGQTQVNLSWSASTDSGTGVAGYRVFRDGTAVGTSTSTSYSDTGLLANTLYTYTVSAYDAATPANESVPSAPSTATTLSASAFQSQDIGAPALVGSFTENGGVYTMRASGADIWGDTDAFRYGWQALSGDGQITVRVASLSNTHSWAKAGLMLRETLTATSRHASMFLTVGAGAVFQYRTATGGASGPSGGGDLSNQAPYWLRLVRQGNVITGYSSPNGVTWTQRGTVTLANLPANVYVGLAYTSHNDAVLGTAQFDNLALSGWPP